jgi:hypothetical protein
MWIMGRLNGEHVFASVSVDHVDHLKIAVRTRNRLDADRMAKFLDAEVTPTPTADYQWRVVVEPADYKRLLAAMANEIDYERFKPTIPDDESWRYEVYLGCWGELLRLRHPDLALIPDEVNSYD